MKVAVAWQLLRKTVDAWSDDKAARLGAALAYYALFSMAPLLVMAVAIAGLVFGEAAARDEIVEQIRGEVGQPVAEAIEEMLKRSNTIGGCTSATIISLGLLLLGASGMLMQVQDALNTIWKVTPKPGRGIVGIVRDRLCSFVLVLGAGLLLMGSLLVSTALAAAGKFLTPTAIPGGLSAWQATHGLVSLAIAVVVFALMYKFLPDVQLRWRDVWVGAAVTAVLFAIGEHLVGWYLGRSSTTSTFGAAGSLVVLVLWVYYSSQILLFGAEFTRAYASMAGSPVAPADNAVAVAPEANPARSVAWAASTKKAANDANRREYAAKE